MNIKAVPLKWGEYINTDIVPDKILLADCIYYAEVENTNLRKRDHNLLTCITISVLFVVLG